MKILCPECQNNLEIESIKCRGCGKVLVRGFGFETEENWSVLCHDCEIAKVPTCFEDRLHLAIKNYVDKLCF